MPLDEVQKQIIRILLKNRSPSSVFAGGSVLQRHAHRLSDDHDIFHSASADLMAVAEKDVALLHSAGLAADVTRTYSGFVEAIVGNETQGMTRIQWVQVSEWTFFAPVPDPEYGWRLHMADIATNKILAAADRREVRDYVDLLFIHRHVMPLWHAAWAAPGKDEGWTPASIVERIAMGNNFRQAEIDAEIVSTVPISAADLGQSLRAALDEARQLFARLPKETAGRLFVSEDGAPALDSHEILKNDGNLPASMIALEAKRGGAWPSGPDVDRIMIERIIGAYGYDGEGTPDPAKDQEPGPR